MLKAIEALKSQREAELARFEQTRACKRVDETVAQFNECVIKLIRLTTQLTSDEQEAIESI